MFIIDRETLFFINSYNSKSPLIQQNIKGFILILGFINGAVIGIIISGIQYSASAGDPTAMAKAKKRIIEIIIGVLAYGLLWGFLNWLIPGGLF